MRVEVKKVDVSSLVKICFVMYAILGMIIGLVYVVIALVFGSLLGAAGALEGTGLFRLAATGVGILLVPLFALMYGIIGALAGLVGAVVYNLIAKALGGIRLTFDTEGTEVPPGGSINQVTIP